MDTEPEFQKAERNGFRDTFADQWLKTWGIDTLIAAGFSLRSCLYHTCIGALEHNDRVVLLRDCTDPPGTKEFPDTLDPANPEGGWLRFAVRRIVETNEGYTSTAGEFVEACGALQGHAAVGGTSSRQMGAPVALSRPADAPSPGSRRGASP